MTAFNPYQAPDTEVHLQAGPHVGESGAWHDGSTLVMSKGGELPDRCIKCNQPANGYQLTRRLSWHPPVWYLMFVFFGIIYVLLLATIQRTATIQVSLCDQHRRKRRRTFILGWLIAFVGLGIAFGGGSISPQGAPLAIVVISGFVVFLGGWIYGMVGSQPFKVIKIDKHFVWLTKVNPDFCASLPAW